MRSRSLNGFSVDRRYGQVRHNWPKGEQQSPLLSSEGSLLAPRNSSLTGQRPATPCASRTENCRVPDKTFKTEQLPMLSCTPAAKRRGVPVQQLRSGSGEAGGQAFSVWPAGASLEPLARASAARDNLVLVFIMSINLARAVGNGQYPSRSWPKVWPKVCGSCPTVSGRDRWGSPSLVDAQGRTLAGPMDDMPEGHSWAARHPPRNTA